jgi:hypothetical protein
MEPTITMSLREYLRMKEELDENVRRLNRIEFSLDRLHKTTTEDLLKRYEEFEHLESKRRVHQMIREGKF